MLKLIFLVLPVLAFLLLVIAYDAFDPKLNGGPLGGLIFVGSVILLGSVAFLFGRR